MRARVVEGCKGDLETMAKCLKEGIVATCQLASCLFKEQPKEFEVTIHGNPHWDNLQMSLSETPLKRI